MKISGIVSIDVTIILFDTIIHKICRIKTTYFWPYYDNNYHFNYCHDKESIKLAYYDILNIAAKRSNDEGENKKLDHIIFKYHHCHRNYYNCNIY